VTTLGAYLRSSDKERLAFMAGPPNTLPGLLIDKVLSAPLTRPGENHLLGAGEVVVVGNNGCLFLVLLDEGSLALTAGLFLGFGAPRRVAGAFGTACMLALRALLGGTKRGSALMASAVDAHADGLLYA